MKLLLFSLGTRGDMEPFLAIGLQFQQRGWEVRCGMPAQFQELVEKAGLEFRPLSKQFLELLEGDAAKSVMGQKGSLGKRIQLLRQLYKDSMQMQRDLLEDQKAIINAFQPDRILYNGKCFYPVLWGMAQPGQAVLISPVTCMIHPVRHMATVGINVNLGPALNRLTYALSNTLLWRSVYSFTKRFHPDFPQLRITPRSIRRSVMQQEKMIYTVSPALFPRPQVQVLGYHERPQTMNWEPSPELRQFLDKHARILFVTFGSMSNSNPAQKTQDILSLLARHQIPAIVNTSWGGLVEPEQKPDHVFFVNRIPYDWIFPRMYAILHHGGSGTTHLAMKSGCANLIIPHILDQFLWNQTIARLGAGPKGMPIKQLTAARLEPKLLDLWNKAAYKENARRISQQMQAEQFEDALYEAVER